MKLYKKNYFQMMPMTTMMASLTVKIMMMMVTAFLILKVEIIHFYCTNNIAFYCNLFRIQKISFLMYIDSLTKFVSDEDHPDFDDENDEL